MEAALQLFNFFLRFAIMPKKKKKKKKKKKDLSFILFDTNTYSNRTWVMQHENEVSLVVFYNISTLISYLRPNPVYTYILNIYDL